MHHRQQQCRYWSVRIWYTLPEVHGPVLPFRHLYSASLSLALSLPVLLAYRRQPRLRLGLGPGMHCGVQSLYRRR